MHNPSRSSRISGRAGASAQAAAPQTRKQKCFLVCNAHLDPVWLWPWEEGLTEAISTYRVAADFCDQYPDFVFNHNESLLYEWVERNDPALFRRIQRLVKTGQWHVAGGSFIQPDLIAGSGESMIRHFLIGKKYFAEKFGVEPTTAYNFDSFGHPQGFAQILQGCGIDSYVFCRPHRSVLPLPTGSFRWVHGSGAEVIARRSDDHYITQGAILKDMTDGKWWDFYKTEGDFMFLWGIGNHGGGPSRAEYADVQKLNKLFPETEFIESTPEDFFRHSLAIRGRDSLPVVHGDFKPVQEGCYTSMQLIKWRHRQLENLVNLTEKLAAMAWWRKRREYPETDLTVAWKDILFSEFHDILPGSGVPTVEQDSLSLLGHAEEILRRKKAEVMISLLNDEPLAERNETPLFIFNPHSWEVTQEVEIEYGMDRQFGTDGAERWVLRNGRKIPAQFEKAEDNLMNSDWGEWRRKAVFMATIPPLSYQRFETGYRPIPKEKIKRWASPPLPAGDLFKIKTKSIEVELDLKTGLLNRVACGGKGVLENPSCLFQVYADINHSWSTIPTWTKPIGEFKLATSKQAAQIIGSAHTHKAFPQGKPPISIIEDGPIRIVIEAIFVYGASYIAQQYIINKHRPVLALDQTIFWAEHDTRLKMELIHAKELTRIEAEKCYSIDDETEGSITGFEKDFQHFLRLSGGKGAPAFAVVSHGTHSYSHLGNQLRLGILRSPSYGTHEENVPKDFDRYLNRYIRRQDQGLRRAKFTLLFGNEAKTSEAVSRAAWEANIPLAPFIYFPTKRVNTAPGKKPFASVDAANVLVVAIKKSERGEKLVFRVWETGGRATKCDLAVEGKKHSISIGPRQLKTFVLTRAGKLTETNLIENITEAASPAK